MIGNICNRSSCLTLFSENAWLCIADIGKDEDSATDDNSGDGGRDGDGDGDGKN